MSQERFKPIAAVYLVIIKENKIFLSKRRNTGYADGYYGFPSGHLEKDETLKQGLLREAKEEVNLGLELADLKLVHVMHRSMSDDSRIDFFFTVEKWKGVPKNMELDRCDEVGWFELNNLPDKIIPYIEQAIDAILNNVIYSEREEDESYLKK